MMSFRPPCSVEGAIADHRPVFCLSASSRIPRRTTANHRYTSLLPVDRVLHRDPPTHLRNKASRRQTDHRLNNHNVNRQTTRRRDSAHCSVATFSARPECAGLQLQQRYTRSTPESATLADAQLFQG
ncbi:PREDICTED: uncharacterized protein LOC106742030 [Dinoponera quadriceps]|uniref:Uncharacterized protein LOC106742030 n=1 Tax=Dinoponera quadriceps TaxID=609295 RepID=A0A6P3WVM3_DINQU|nr:PREDICTED: uncharacterized protein LOC106742030 [Dinoponera quadriceps]